MKLSDALAKKSDALYALTAQIAHSHSSLQQCDEASVIPPNWCLETAAAIISREEDANIALKTYGDIDLIALDQDDIDAMAVNHATALAAARNKEAGSDYYSFIEGIEEIRLDNALKFARAINSVNI